MIYNILILGISRLWWLHFSCQSMIFLLEQRVNLKNVSTTELKWLYFQSKSEGCSELKLCKIWLFLIRLCHKLGQYSFILWSLTIVMSSIQGPQANTNLDQFLIETNSIFSIDLSLSMDIRNSINVEALHSVILWILITKHSTLNCEF